MKVTREILSYIENLRKDGKSYKEIRICTGLSKGTLSLYLKDKPCGAIVLSKKISSETIENILHFRRMGKTQEQIAKELNISQASVQRYVIGIKINIPKKTIRASEPFEDYMLYGPYYCKSAKRNKVILVNEVNSSKLQMTWTRYLICVKTNRILRSEEHVDHIDDVSFNDELDNLQILNHRDHAKKTLIDKAVTKTIATIQCPECGSIFDRARNRTHIVNKRSKRTFCDRSCAAKYYKRDGPKIDPQSTIRAITKVPLFKTEWRSSLTH